MIKLVAFGVCMVVAGATLLLLASLRSAGELADKADKARLPWEDDTSSNG
jgi:hypothetical protein